MIKTLDLNLISINIQMESKSTIHTINETIVSILITILENIIFKQTLNCYNILCLKMFLSYVLSED